MKKDVVLKISGRTISSIPHQEGLEEPIEFTTVGEMQTRGDITKVSYEETPLSGMPGVTASLTFTPGKLRMKRVGVGIDGETVMEFEEGKRYSGMYSTPFGDIDMEILTSRISALEPAALGAKRCSVEYAISLKGLVEATKTLDIEIREN